MKRNRLFLTIVSVIFVFQFLFGQTPPSNLMGEALKQWLRDSTYTNKMVPLGYTTARMYMYNYIDNHSDTITDVYGGYKKYWPYGGTGTNPDPINCEHTVPQSFFNYNEPMKSDLHHLFPCYNSWNSTRSNYPFAEIPDTETTKWMRYDVSQSTIPTSNIDEYSEYANGKFEPREDHKGNVARAIFYFYTMYPTQAGSIDQVADPATLYQWHLKDPVDSLELARNDLIEKYQGNRNPYIDHPELVARAWGFVDTITPPAPPANLTLSSNSTSIILHWQDVNNEDVYTIYRSSDGNSFRSIATVPVNVVTYSDSNVTEGIIYYYYVTASNAGGESSASNVASGQIGSAGTVYASGLFISEYVEGSSYNKAIEIANFTGNDVDLSAFSIKKQTNGAGSWSSPLTLSGILPNNQTYVIVYQSADAALTSKADLLTTSTVMTFNGNDPVGLFQNDQLIDIVGDFNSGGTYFAQNVTLRRNSDVTSPNTTYTLSEWTSYPQDDFSDVGMHTFNGSGTTPLAFVSNPNATNITTNSATIVFSSNSSCTAEIQYGTSPSYGSTASASGTSFSVNLTNLTPNTVYYYQVTLNNGSEMVNSSQQSFQTLLPPPATPSNFTLSVGTNQITLSWSDVQYETNYLIYRSTDNINFSNIATIAADNTVYTDNTVTPNTQYYYYVTARNSVGESAPTAVLSGSVAGNVSSEIFFTEYVEGSRYNKALEIGNFTGQEVNLSSYSIKIAFNGNLTWGDEYFLSGILQNQDVFVLVNSNAKKSLRKKGDVVTNASILNFNGNDVIGLFHNGQLIDVIGTLGSSNYFAQDVTLRRKNTVPAPSSTFSLDDWDKYRTDDFSDLGYYTNTLLSLNNTDDEHEEELSTSFELQYNSPNPFNPVTTIYFRIPQGKRGKLLIYNIHGQLIRSFDVNSNMTSITWDATDMDHQVVPSGIYLYQLRVNDRPIITRKMMFIK